MEQRTGVAAAGAAGALDDTVELHLRALGGSIRALRLARGHSLVDVALGTGLSSSFLSMVENGRSDISTGRLRRLARFLGVGVRELLDMPTRPDVRIVREAVATPVVSELDVGAGAVAIPGDPSTERFALILRGEVEIAVAAGGLHTLAAGDAAYLHAPATEIRNAGDGPAMVLLVASAAPAALRPG
jgi:transcriptional regulator with XRE-family HTH domain